MQGFRYEKFSLERFYFRIMIPESVDLSGVKACKLGVKKKKNLNDFM